MFMKKYIILLVILFFSLNLIFSWYFKHNMRTFRESWHEIILRAGSLIKSLFALRFNFKSKKRLTLMHATACYTKSTSISQKTKHTNGYFHLHKIHSPSVIAILIKFSMRLTHSLLLCPQECSKWKWNSYKNYNIMKWK